MKVRLLEESTAIPGYKKVSLCFGVSGGKLSRKLGKALKREEPVYIAGAEPKVSLYLGKHKIPKENTLTISKVSSDKAAIDSRLSFWDRLKAENPAYTMECICGCMFRVKKHYRSHKKRCSVLQHYSKLHKRVEKFEIAHDYGDAKKKAKGKAKRAEAKREREARNARTSKDSRKTKVRRKTKERSKKRS